MHTYVHQLPSIAQQQGVTHVQLTRLIVEPNMLHAFVEYGILDSDNEFVRDELMERKKLVVNDMAEFKEADSDMETLPSTKGEAMQKIAQGLATYADRRDLWQTIPVCPDFSVTTDGLDASFTDQTTTKRGEPEKWEWDFGDGGSVQTVDATADGYAEGDEDVTHSYGSSGTYTVTLTVTDSLGNTHSRSKDVSVSS